MNSLWTCCSSVFFCIPRVCQLTTASVWIRGSHRPRRHVQCANSGSPGTTRNTQSPILRRRPEDVEKKKEQKAIQTLSAPLSFDLPTLDRHRAARGCTRPPPPLPSASPPPHTVTHLSLAVKVTTPQRRTQTQRVTQMESSTTLMMTPLS